MFSFIRTERSTIVGGSEDWVGQKYIWRPTAVQSHRTPWYVNRSRLNSYQFVDQQCVENVASNLCRHTNSPEYNFNVIAMADIGLKAIKAVVKSITLTYLSWSANAFFSWMVVFTPFHPNWTVLCYRRLCVYVCMCVCTPELSPGTNGWKLEAIILANICTLTE